MQFFGYEVKRKNEEPIESFAPEVKDDGAVVVAAGGADITCVGLSEVLEDRVNDEGLTTINWLFTDDIES